MITDRRVFFVGDSFVAGVGDPDHRGWVGRLAARSHQAGVPLTTYNLGVRRDTAVCRRWPSEVAARRAPGCDERLVVSFGVNDTTVKGGTQRVRTARSVANLRGMASTAPQRLGSRCWSSARHRWTIRSRTSGSRPSARCSAPSAGRHRCRMWRRSRYWRRSRGG